MNKPLDYRQRTPCVGLCSTVYGDLVCRGCRRFMSEIVDWNTYLPEQKAAVWRRLEQFLEQVVMSRIEVVSMLDLRRTLEAANLPGVLDLPLALQVHRLLGRLPEEWPESCGIRPRPDYRSLSRRQLRELIDQDLFALSEAYYQRHLQGRSVARPASP
jgi:uncharacterized protein